MMPLAIFFLLRIVLDMWALFWFHMKFKVFFYCILGLGVHVQNMQDICIGTHMAVCFAAFLPSPTFGISPQAIPPQLTPHFPSPFPPNRPQYVVLPSLCLCVLIVHHTPMSENL